LLRLQLLAGVWHVDPWTSCWAALFTGRLDEVEPAIAGAERVAPRRRRHRFRTSRGMLLERTGDLDGADVSVSA
jgi:hypothetical protein